VVFFTAKVLCRIKSKVRQSHQNLPSLLTGMKSDYAVTATFENILLLSRTCKSPCRLPRRTDNHISVFGKTGAKGKKVNLSLGLIKHSAVNKYGADEE